MAVARCQENTSTSGVRTFSFIDEHDNVITVGGATWWEDWPSFLQSFQGNTGPGTAPTPDLSPYAEACPGWARNPPTNRVTRARPAPPPPEPAPAARPGADVPAPAPRPAGKKV